MISDAIDILDARIVNLTVNFDVLIDPTLNRAVVLQSILAKLQTTFNIKNFNIDQPIVVDDIRNAISTTPGVVSINNLLFQNVSGILANREYSSVTYDVAANTNQGIIFPPGGGIFEVRYPEVDIIGKALV
jgi:Co/Zn/Cd efflux system component